MTSSTKKLRFYSPEGHARVCLPDGRVAIVGDAPRELPPAFNKAAVREGCLTTDMPSADRLKTPEVPAQFDAFERRNAIKNVMHDGLMHADGDPGYEDAFTAQGIPNIAWVSRMVGFTIERSERDELWQEVQAEAEADAGTGDGGGEEDETNIGNVE